MKLYKSLFSFEKKRDHRKHTRQEEILRKKNTQSAKERKALANLFTFF